MIFGAAVAAIGYFLIIGVCIIAFGGISMLALRYRARLNARDIPLRAELSELVDSVHRYTSENHFESRFHPSLFSALEEMSETWFELESLRNSASKDRQLLFRECCDSVIEALLDSLWLGRKLIRRGGMKKSTFKELCEDKGFGAEALAEIELLRKDVQELRFLLVKRDNENVLDRSRLQNTLAHLREREAALEELQVQTLDH